jgi:hypothetical protein
MGKKGEGIAEMIQSAKATVVHKANVLQKKAARTIDTVLNGASNYSRPARDVIRKYGEAEIVKMEVGRTPVQSAITAALNVVSLGSFSKNNPYDKLFHLFLKLTLEDGVVLSLEKNEVITIGLYKDRGNTEYQQVPLGDPTSLKELLEKARVRMGDRFFKYDSASNNCQDFVLNALQASAIGTKANFEFVKQDTEQLFKGLSKTKGVARFVTDLGAKVNALTQGAGVKEKISQRKHMPRFAKGSKEAKAWGEKMRAMRKSKGGSVASDLKKAYEEKIPAKYRKHIEAMAKHGADDLGVTEELAKAKKGGSIRKKKAVAMPDDIVGGSVEGEPIEQRGGGLFAGRSLYAGRSVHVHHHHHYGMEGEGFWDDVGGFAKRAGKAVLKAGLPLAGRTLGGIAGTMAGGPVGSFLGATTGGLAGDELANVATKGWGLKGVGRKARFTKGSPEAKAFMAKLRGMRKKK